MANRKKSTRRPSTTQQRRRHRQATPGARPRERAPELVEELHQAPDTEPVNPIGQASGIPGATEPLSSTAWQNVVTGRDGYRAGRAER